MAEKQKNGRLNSGGGGHSLAPVRFETAGEIAERSGNFTLSAVIWADVLKHRGGEGYTHRTDQIIVSSS